MNQAAAKPPHKGLHIALWVVQGLLAAAFGMAAMMKLSTPYAELAAQQPWARATAEGTVKIIGGVELLGALGLLLPSATRILPWLTPLAASGLLVIMVLAARLHASLGEPVVANLILGALSAFVVWGRFKGAPISVRSAK